MNKFIYSKDGNCVKEKATMMKPHRMAFASLRSYEIAYRKYVNHLASLRTYSVSDEVAWSDGQEIECGKDFTTQYNFHFDQQQFQELTMGEKEKYLVAVPIPPTPDEGKKQTAMDEIAYKEHFRTLRHEMERLLLDFVYAIQHNEPINERDMYKRIKHSLKTTPSIGVQND